MSSSLFAPLSIFVFLLLLSSPREASAFSRAAAPRTVFGAMMRPLSMLPSENKDENAPAEPYFEMHQIPTATTGSKLDHYVRCAENDECDVEEMMEMIEELEHLNKECEGTLSRECSLDAVAARNVLKVALASKVALENAIEECRMDRNPYMDMYEMHDECMPSNMQHQIPTETMDNHELEHMVHCAEGDDECDVGEMVNMIDELERLNAECEGTMSRECSLQAREARNLLKVALASQVAVADVKQQRTTTGGGTTKKP